MENYNTTTTLKHREGGEGCEIILGLRGVLNSTWNFLNISRRIRLHSAQSAEDTTVDLLPAVATAEDPLTATAVEGKLALEDIIVFLLKIHFSIINVMILFTIKILLSVLTGSSNLNEVLSFKNVFKNVNLKE